MIQRTHSPVSQGRLREDGESISAGGRDQLQGRGSRRVGPSASFLPPPPLDNSGPLQDKNSNHSFTAALDGICKDSYAQAIALYYLGIL